MNDENPAEVLDQAIQEYAKTHGVGYVAAWREIEKERPELFEAYENTFKPKPDQAVEGDDQLIQSIAEKKGISYVEAYDLAEKKMSKPLSFQEKMFVGTVKQGDFPELSLATIRNRFQREFFDNDPYYTELVDAAFQEGGPLHDSALYAQGYKRQTDSSGNYNWKKVR